jgi:hypothetical protein
MRIRPHYLFKQIFELLLAIVLVSLKMKYMKSASRILLTSALTALSFGAITYTACKKDKCKDVSCQNGGVCSGGVCNCPANYSGSHCEVAGACAGIVCQHGGTCNNGICACPSGYEGSYCETESRAKFTKTWNASDTDSYNNNPVSAYQPVISNDTTITQVRVSLMRNGFFSHDVIATVNGDSLIIASQQPDASINNYSISGSAVYVNDTIYWRYQMTTPGIANYKGTWR